MIWAFVFINYAALKNSAGGIKVVWEELGNAIFRIQSNSLAMPITVFAATYFLVFLIKFIAQTQLKALAQRTNNKFDDILIGAISEIHWPFNLIISLYTASHFAPQYPQANTWLGFLALIIFLYYAVRILQKIIRLLIDGYVYEHASANKGHDPGIIIFLSKFTSYSLWLLAALIILDNIGFDINALLAGLGIAGIAIALALQNVLADVFSAISIYFDKPFRKGDFIILGAEMGTVQKVGIKTTRIQALQGEEIVISNRELTETRIHNYGRMAKRRVQFNTGITYETPEKKMPQANEIIRKSIESVKGAEVDRVHFKEFGDFSLIFEAVYYLPTSDYNAYMDAQQKVNTEIMKGFAKNKIEFAYPTSKVFLAK